jgi:hypothetical protein
LDVQRDNAIGLPSSSFAIPASFDACLFQSLRCRSIAPENEEDSSPENQPDKVGMRVFCALRDVLPRASRALPAKTTYRLFLENGSLPSLQVRELAEEPPSDTGQFDVQTSSSSPLLSLSRDVVDRLRTTVFGYDSFFVTSVENYDANGVLFKGNLRGQPEASQAALKRRLQVLALTCLSLDSETRGLRRLARGRGAHVLHCCYCSQGFAAIKTLHLHKDIHELINAAARKIMDSFLCAGGAGRRVRSLPVD